MNNTNVLKPCFWGFFHFWTYFLEWKDYKHCLIWWKEERILKGRQRLQKTLQVGENKMFLLAKSKTKCKYQEKDEWHISQCHIAGVVRQLMDIGIFRNGNLPRVLSSSAHKNEEFEGSRWLWGLDHALSGPCSACGVHSCTGQGGKGSQKERNPWIKVWG